MTILRSGSSSQYAQNWSKAFRGESKKKVDAKSTKKKSKSVKKKVKKAKK